MIVKNILAGKGGNVLTINPTADVIAAAKLMAERGIGARTPSSRDEVRTQSCLPLPDPRLLRSGVFLLQTRRLPRLHQGDAR